jgi:hypothetical protein
LTLTFRGQDPVLLLSLKKDLLELLHTEQHEHVDDDHPGAAEVQLTTQIQAMTSVLEAVDSDSEDIESILSSCHQFMRENITTN